MSKESILERLEKRAKLALSNPAEVTSEALELALLEADELIENKVISDALKTDIAYFRLILMLKKGGVDEDEIKLYDKALLMLKNAPIKSSEDKQINSTAKVVQRIKTWI